MGNKSVTPFLSYEAACQHLNDVELKHLKAKFKKLCRNGITISPTEFCQIPAECPPYLRKHFLPRLFAIIDSKKDNVIDLEEYISAIAMFRVGALEEKIRVLFMMYEPSKGGILNRESLRQLLIDSAVIAQRSELSSLNTTDERLELQRDIISGMVEAAVCQFGTAEGKLDLQEFSGFVKVEGGVQALLQFVPEVIDC